MSGQFSRFLQLPISLAMLLCIAPLANSAGFDDQFNDGSITDGNPITWSTNPLGAFPGNYDASSGTDLRLSAPGGGNNNQLVAFVDSFVANDMYIRAQGRVLPGSLPEEDGGNLALLGRLDNTSISGFVLYLDSGGTLGLQISLGGQLQDITPTVELGELNALSDVIMELDLVVDQISGYVWRPGQSKPATPQISASNVSFLSGKAGIAYDEDDDNTTAVYDWAKAQDTPFVDAQPGDFNGDSRVDAADYAVWRKGMQGGTFDQDDYNAWRANFGVGTGSGSLVGAAVPEPVAMAQLVLAIAGFLAGAARRRSLLG